MNERGFAGDIHGFTSGKLYRFRGDCEECLLEAWERMTDGGVTFAGAIVYARGAKPLTRMGTCGHDVSRMAFPLCDRRTLCYSCYTYNRNDF